LPTLPAAQQPSSRTAAVVRVALLLAGLVVLAVSLLALLDGLAFLLAWTVGVVAAVVARRRRFAGLARRMEDASHMLVAGEVDAAIREFDALCAASRWVPTYHALCVFYRGAAALEAGEVDQALALLVAARDSGWFDWQRALGGYAGALHAKIAVAHALRDEAAQATEALALAQQHLTPARRGSLLRDEIVVLARNNDHTGALRRIDEDHEHAERHLPAARMRAIRVLQAFCEQTPWSANYRAPASSADPREALADRITRASLERLASRWPALHSFLQALAAPI
jgi:hypothetical protein